MVLLHFLVVVYDVLVEDIPGFDIFHIGSLTIAPRARDMSERGRRTNGGREESAQRNAAVHHTL